MTIVAERPKRDMLVEFVDNRLEDGGLPEVVAFVCDERTRDMLANYFANRGLASRVGTGGIVGAIDYVSDNPQPSLLIVDLSASANRGADIDRLADVCEPGLHVIALGTENDVGLYRELIEAGFSDYLVKPVGHEILHRTIDRISRHAEDDTDQSKKGDIVVFVGARGGVGSSTLAVNAAWHMGDKKEKKVVVVDLDLQFGSVALALDVEPGRGLREMLENPGRIDGLFVASAAANAGRNVQVLGSEEILDGDVNYTAEALELLLGELQRGFDFVIVDVPRSSLIRHTEVLSLASTVALVSDLSIAGMRDTMRLMQLVKTVNPKARQLVIANKVGSDRKNDLPRGEFERGIEAKLSFIVPDDSKAAKAANNTGKPIQVTAKGSKVATALSKLCDAIAEAPKGREGGKGRGRKKVASEAKEQEAGSASVSMLQKLWRRS